MFKELDNLRLFFEEPEREFHLRELARLMKKNPVTVKSALLKPVQKKIITVKKERGLELYSSNIENKNYKEYKKIFNRMKLIESGFLEFLENQFNYPVIILFGSYGRGEDNNISDIDIFILTEIKKNILADKYEKKLKRRIQLHIMNRKEFEKHKRANPELINSIINGFVIGGFFEVL